jgi:1-acyl-sn-glycerol-3-phosphate acyltransferase
MNALERGFTACFGTYLGWLLQRSFRGVWIARDAAFPRGGFIAAANHTSWWDGFVPFAVQARLAPLMPFALMMDAAQLQRFPFFRLGGAFGIDPRDKRGAYASIQRAAASARGGAGVTLQFARGYLHAAQQARVPVVPVSMRFAVLEAQRPDAFIEIGKPLDASDPLTALRAPQTITGSLAALDEEIRAGSVFERRVSLFRRAPGIDDVVARFAARPERT